MENNTKIFTLDEVYKRNFFEINQNLDDFDVLLNIFKDIKFNLELESSYLSNDDLDAVNKQINCLEENIRVFENALLSQESKVCERANIFGQKMIFYSN